jgi:hypothetical protein
MYLVERQPQGTFTTQELARLEVYRAAVAAGFYTDWDGTAASTDTWLLTRLLRAQRPGAYPFTAEERRGLGDLRKRVAGGEFGDDRPVVVSEPSEPATQDAEGPLTE